MITLEHFVASFSSHDTADFIIDSDGDTILTFDTLYMGDVKVDSTPGFQVSSAILQRESEFFKIQFKNNWIPPVEQDGKYHISIGFNGDDLVGVLIFLLTMHQEFATRSNNLDFLPYRVSMRTLGTIVQLTDSFQTRPAGELVVDRSLRWLDHLKRNNGLWALPKSLKGRMMQWYCVARDFEDHALMEVVKHTIFCRCPQVANNFSWPVRTVQLEALEQDRGWYGF